MCKTKPNQTTLNGEGKPGDFPAGTKDSFWNAEFHLLISALADSSSSWPENTNSQIHKNESGINTKYQTDIENNYLAWSKLIFTILKTARERDDKKVKKIYIKDQTIY